MKRLASILVVLIVVSVFLGTVAYLWKKSRKPEVVYKTASPVVTDIVKKAVATGSVVPRKEVEIKPQVSGIVDKLYVEPGSKVKRGDPVAKIRVIPQMAQLSSAQNRVDLAQVNLENADREFERQDKLRKDGIVSDETYRQAEVERDRARAELRAAKDALDVVVRGTAERNGSEANTMVRATIDGTILEVPVEEGNSVIEANTFNAGTTIATVADMSELIFKGNVDESEVGKLKTGMDLLLTIGAIEGKRFHAVLERIAPKGVEVNGAMQFEIRAAIDPDPGTVIRANYSANADIVLGRRDKVLALDEGLLKFDGDKPYVEVETSPQHFERRDVVTGLSDGINIEIVKGLKQSDRVKGRPVDEATQG